MGKIQALSEDVIGKIAAGEVVERPAAAVKEMCENSLDAGSSAITIEIREDACDYIRVTDNGSGIEAADLRLAFMRHATSKIRLEEDLDAIMTLGFRGEALASIAAVGRVTLITRTAQMDTGIRVQNDGGQIIGMEETACPAGTTIIVRDLFFNTPVRRSFLKKPAIEAGAVTDLIAHLILSRPDVSFRLISSGKTVYHSPGDGKTASAVHTVFGSAALKQMRPVEGHMNGVMVSGYVGIGELGRSNRNGEYFFINQRMMRSGTLSAALENACRERVMIGKFPMAVLRLEVPYESVNVNVHPNKLEVRFQNESGVREALETIVREALQDQDAFEKPVEMKLETAEDRSSKPADETLKEAVRKLREEPRVTVTMGDTVPKTQPVSEKTILSPMPFRTEGNHLASEVPPDSHRIREREEMTFPQIPENAVIPLSPDMRESSIGETFIQQKPIKAEINDKKEESRIPRIPAEEIRAENVKQEQLQAEVPNIAKPMKIFGALFDTYILLEYEDQLLLVDQHAVHERLLFDHLISSYGKERMGQEMLVPLTMSVTRNEMRLLEENRDLLEGIGLVAEPFGETDVAIRTMPVVLGDVQPTAFLRDVIGDLEAGHAPTFEKKRTALLQTACKHAVKGGEKLGEDQLRHLVEQMIEQKVTPTCPHGRPLVVAISHRELDKKFRRIQD